MIAFNGPDELKVNGTVFRRVIADAHYNGRLPLARCTWGFVDGLGWGFLPPWAQLAVFPEKGTQAGIGHRHRQHEPFFVRALVPIEGWMSHPRMAWSVKGRYWEGVVWRASWGRQIRRCLLDPDIVEETTHPGRYDDWLRSLA